MISITLRLFKIQIVFFNGLGNKNLTVDCPFVISSGQSTSVAAINLCGAGPFKSLSGISLDPGFCSRISASGEINKVSIYPNPTSDVLKLDYTGKQPHSIVVFNMLGEYLNRSGWQLNISVTQLPQGMYILRTQREKDVVIRFWVMSSEFKINSNIQGYNLKETPIT